MKAHYRAFGGRLVIEMEATTIKDLFSQIGPIAEVLDADQTCGACNAPTIYPRAREAKKSDGKTVTYYELVCGHCTAKLSFGQHSEGGTLWAKRENDQKEPLLNRGWLVYRGIAAPRTEDAPPPRTQPPARKAVVDGRAIPETDPILAALIERANSTHDERRDVEAELCEELFQVGGQKLLDQEWKKAIAGNPEPDTILMRLYLSVKVNPKNAVTK